MALLCSFFNVYPSNFLGKKRRKKVPKIFHNKKENEG